MMIFVGAVFLLLGLLSGLILLLAPLGLSGTGTANPVTWFMFPAMSIAGYVTLAGAGREALPRLSAIAGGALLLMAVAALVALFLAANGILPSGAESPSLWYVFGVGMVLGGTAFSIRRPSAGPGSEA